MPSDFRSRFASSRLEPARQLMGVLRKPTNPRFLAGILFFGQARPLQERHWDPSQVNHYVLTQLMLNLTDPCLRLLPFQGDRIDALGWNLDVYFT